MSGAFSSLPLPRTNVTVSTCYAFDRSELGRARFFLGIRSSDFFPISSLGFRISDFGFGSRPPPKTAKNLPLSLSPTPRTLDTTGGSLSVFYTVAHHSKRSLPKWSFSPIFILHPQGEVLLSRPGPNHPFARRRHAACGGETRCAVRGTSPRMIHWLDTH